MGVTLPPDFCRHCHAGVAEERPTHLDISFDTCASAGCHNYHDNRSLYEDFLARHAGSEAETVSAELPFRKAWISRKLVERAPLTAVESDGPPRSASDLIGAWAGSGHAAAGVNCSDCHLRPGDPRRRRILHRRVCGCGGLAGVRDLPQRPQGQSAQRLRTGEDHGGRRHPHTVGVILRPHFNLYPRRSAGPSASPVSP